MPVGAVTPLERAVGAPQRRRPGPLDALRAGRQTILRGDPIDMCRIASGLGIGRATLYRWVGDRDRFTSAAIWSLTADTFADALRREAGVAPGAERATSVLLRFVRSLSSHPAFSALVGRDPEYALRLITGPGSSVHQNVTDAVAQLLRDQGEHLKPPLPYDTLAYVVVRVLESFLYSDIITGRPLDLDNATVAVRLLLQAPS